MTRNEITVPQKSISNSRINPIKWNGDKPCEPAEQYGINVRSKLKFPKRFQKSLEVLHIKPTLIALSPVEIYKVLWVYTWIPKIEYIKTFCHVHAHHCPENSVHSLLAEQCCKLSVILLLASHLIVSTLLALRNRISHYMSTLNSGFW